jgi:hypothetical protein
MQVSSEVSSDKYALVGGAAPAEAFKIHASAQAYKLLSAGLYSDIPLAVVREVICNAQDAHIAAGIERPIEVKLTEAEFSVRDFGAGIDPKKMADIYCTYFGSTKQLDDSQTGGFGLGAKSPFAYSDYFTVINHHKGTRYTYVVTVGDEEVNDGAPSMRLMTQGLTTESGICVQVPIEPKDRLRFDDKIRRVSKTGGITLLLNGELHSGRDYSELKKHGYGASYGSLHGETPFSVLYGNVLYPISNDAVDADLRQIQTKHFRGHCAIIFYAPPSSITPMPNREGLNYNSKTIATLKGLIQKADKQIGCRTAHEVNRVVHDHLKKATRLNFLSKTMRAPEGAYYGPATAVVAAHFYLLGRSNGQEVLIKAANRLFHDHRIKKNVPSWAYSVATKHAVYTSEREIRSRYILRRLWRAVSAVGLQDCLMYRPPHGALEKISKQNNLSGLCLQDAALSIRIVSHVSVAQRPDFESAYEKPAGFFIVKKDITCEEIEALQKTAERFGFSTSAYSAMRPPKRVEKKVKPAPKAETYQQLVLKHVWQHRCGSGVYAVMDETKQIAKPSVYFVAKSMRRVRNGLENDLVFSIDRGSLENLKKVLKLFPQTVLCRNLSEAETVKKLGAISLEEALLQKLFTWKRNASEDGFIPFMATHRDVPYCIDRATSLAIALMSVNTRLAHLAIGLPTPKQKDGDERLALWQLVLEFFNIRHRDRYRSLGLHEDEWFEFHTYLQAHRENAAYAIKDPGKREMAFALLGGDVRDRDCAHLESLWRFIRPEYRSSYDRSLDKPSIEALANILEGHLKSYRKKEKA